jgi:ABC-type sugar transport system ATPase subunit
VAGVVDSGVCCRENGDFNGCCTSKCLVIDQRVQLAAARLNIEPFLAREPKARSDGQRQRVAIGRAIVRNLKLFLFDEPLSNLDAELRVQMRVVLS